MITIENTSKFSIFSVLKPATDRNIGSYTASDFDNIRSSLQQFGFCVCRNIIAEECTARALSELLPFIKMLQRSYDDTSDEFDLDCLDDDGITRYPRIGRGKHNFHFDPIDGMCIYHRCLAKLAEASNFQRIISEYLGRKCHLRETGISITHPLLAGGVAGDGMEWHSDGAEGECTVILSLLDITEEQGSVGLVPASHLDFVPGVGHGAIDAEKIMHIEDREVRYLYKRLEMLVFDARTLHGAQKNVSKTKWRWICWFIYDSY